MKYLHMITGALMCVLVPVPSGSFPFQRSALDPIPESSSDNVECFLDYMELWVSRRQMEVSLSSLDRSNHLISRCRYALDMDSNGNFIFRVHYTACNVQTQNGFHVLEIHIVKKTSVGKGRSDRYLLRCPAMTAALGREKVRCDHNYVQVSRPMPLGNSDDQDWFLAFRGELVVSVEDASLIGVEVEMNNSSVTVRGLRGHLLNPKEFLERQMDVLPLWMARGFYAYSLEASCPLVSQHPEDEVMLHIPKQRMGLVKRGSYITETLTLRNIVAVQSINVTVTENKHFVMINIPAIEVLQRQDCNTTVENSRGVQVFYSIDLVLEFAEIAYPMNWTLENYYECTALPPDVTQPNTLSKSNEKMELSADTTANETVAEQEILGSLYTRETQDGTYPINSVPELKNRHQNSTEGSSQLQVEIGIEHSGEEFDMIIIGSGDYSEVPSRRTQPSDFGSAPPEYIAGFTTFPNNLTAWSFKVTKPPNVFNVSSTAPPLPQSKISNDDFQNSSTYKESKSLLILSRVSSKLAGLSSPVEFTGKNMTFNINTTEEEKKRQMPMPVTEERGSEKDSGRPVTYSPEAKQEDTSKPVNLLHVDSQPISDSRMSTSSQRPMDVSNSWEMLTGDSLSELQDEAARDELISPIYRHRPSRRKEIEFTEKTEAEKGPANDQEKSTNQMPIPMVNGQGRPNGDLQYLSGTINEQNTSDSDKESLLSSNHLDSIVWSISNSLPEETLNSTARELETMGSAEQLLLST